ncbi:MAG: hypothetical protein GY710_12055 [Desulfobacteraceae bacterium]|nr:hypothetical protein [Desulfobacteraceae bacterium]
MKLPIISLSDNEIELVKAVLDMGGSITIAILIIIALALIAWKLSAHLVKFSGDLVMVMQNQADALAGQATAMGEMKDALNLYVLKDNDEHREILLGLSVMAREMKDLTQVISELKQ